MGKHKKKKSNQNKGQATSHSGSKSQASKAITFDNSKPNPEISNTATVEARNEQILANLPKSRYKVTSDEHDLDFPDDGFLVQAEFSSEPGDSPLSFGLENENLKELKELKEELVDDVSLSSLTALPGFTSGGGAAGIRQSKEFREFSDMIKKHGFTQKQEYDAWGNLRSVVFTNKAAKKSSKKNKKIKEIENLEASGESNSPILEDMGAVAVTIETEKDDHSSDEEDHSDSGCSSDDSFDNGDDPFFEDFERLKKMRNRSTSKKQTAAAISSQRVKGAETDIGRAIEESNEKLLEKARHQMLNCDDIAKHTAFLAEQRQNLKEQMETLHKKIRIHHSLLKVNGRNLSKHFSTISSLERVICATKRDSIRFNIILNQFLSSPAYATMLKSFERVTKSIPKAKAGKKKKLPGEFFDGPDELSFEELLAEEKKNTELNAALKLR